MFRRPRDIKYLILVDATAIGSRLKRRLEISLPVEGDDKEFVVELKSKVHEALDTREHDGVEVDVYDPVFHTWYGSRACVGVRVCACACVSWKEESGTARTLLARAPKPGVPTYLLSSPSSIFSSFFLLLPFPLFLYVSCLFFFFSPPFLLPPLLLLLLPPPPPFPFFPFICVTRTGSS